jgi:zinc protease
MKIRFLPQAFIAVVLMPVMLLLCRSESYAVEARREVLASGLIMLHTERANIPVVRIKLLIKASLLNEPPEKAGLANLTAEMLTGGTSALTARQIDEDMDFMGALLHTRADSDYTMISLSALKKDLDKAFEIFSDIVQNPSFPQDELKVKKELITGSLKQDEESPSFLAQREFMKAVYGTHPYGRLNRGTPETVDAVGRQDLIAFHRALYVPGNAVMSVSGDVSYDEITALMGKYFKEWKNNAQADTAVRFAYPAVSFTDPAHEKKTVVIDRKTAQASIIFGHTGLSRDNPDYDAVSVMNYILGGGGFSSRLMKTVRDEMGLAYGVYSHFMPKKYGGVFEIAVQTKNESSGTVAAEILKQVGAIKAGYVSDDELDTARSYLTGSFPRRLDTMEKVAELLALSEFYGLGADFDIKYINAVKAVTKEDVKRVAQKYLDDEKYVFVVVGDSGKIGRLDIINNSNIGKGL